MQIIPFEIDHQHYNVFIVLEKDNLERIMVNDPAQFALAKLPVPWADKKLHTVLIGYCAPEDIAKLREVKEGSGNVMKLLQWLSRGFKFRPDSGDNDLPYK